MDEGKIFENFESAVPAFIESKNVDGTVNVKPCIVKISNNGVFDIDNAPIPNVPVLNLGGGQFIFEMPVSVGDGVLLIAISRDSEKWKKSDWKTELIPDSCSGNTLCDFVAIPLSFKSKPASKTKISIADDGSVTINGHLKVSA